MTAERWRQVEAILQRALDIEAGAEEERAVFIAEACAGDTELQAAVERLIAADEEANSFIEAPVWIYSELRALAGNYLNREYRKNHTLQPTALVHEAYLRLVNQKAAHWESRSHFFGAAANVMRQILVDHARHNKAEKRGGEVEKMQLEESIVIESNDRNFELLDLNEALEELAKIDEQKAKIVELRYFGGLSIEETAEVLGVSEITVKRHWRVAKAWLYDWLKPQ